MALKKYRLVIQTAGLSINGHPIESDSMELPLRAENQADAQARGAARVAQFEAMSGNVGVSYQVVEVVS